MTARCGRRAPATSPSSSPRRTVLDVLEDGLDAAGIPYRTESSSLAYASREVRDLLLALRAIDDPTDELALVSTLRSPLFGCSDVDCYRWRTSAGGRWNLVGGHRPRAASPATTRSTTPSPTSGRWPPIGTGRRRPSCSIGWSATAASWRSPGTGRRSRDVWRRVRYLSTRPGPGGRPAAARCATTWRGPTARPPTACGSPRRCCPRPTTTPCGS